MSSVDGQDDFASAQSLTDAFPTGLRIVADAGMGATPGLGPAPKKGARG